ncbi:MAG: PmeII family type II restriction endonuclease [bacterium]
MNKSQKIEILNKAKSFFRNNIAANHVKNTAKLKELKEFNINPFLVTYLSNYLTGNHDPKSIAKALIYPRVLGTSINTSFGTHVQKFCSEVLDGFGSVVAGIDIEFIDTIDGRKKYCQIKAGPNTINKDDIDTIDQHFNTIKNLARTNNKPLQINDLIVGVLYGTNDELSSHYKVINKTYPVIPGQVFWHRLTGDSEFYFDLINSFGEVAIEADSTELLDDVINKLASNISKNEIFDNLYD